MATNIPMVMGLETEYGISVDTEHAGLGHLQGSYSSYEVVSSVSKLNRSLIDRGLEDIEIDEHEQAEAQADHVSARRLRDKNSLPLQPRDRWDDDDGNLIPARDKSLETRRDTHREAALRQRMGFTGFILENGARYYVDMGHPEMSTPETLDPYTLVAAQKAGDLIVEECRRIAEISMGILAKDRDLKIHIHRNNSDGQGNSYAGHENYLLSVGLFEEIVYCMSTLYDRASRRHYKVFREGPTTQAVAKFFATRQIITGSGKVGSEKHDEIRNAVPYQISQRSDFMMRIVGVSTVEWRGIINTRNQPLADIKTMRRFHVICGDSNMSELSIYLKCGITALFLKMMEHGYIQRASGDIMTPLFDALAAYHTVSRDLGLNERLPLMNAQTTTALETQIRFCELAQTFVRAMELAPVWHDIARKWEAVLNGLAHDRAKDPWAKNLDWVVKEQLLQNFQKRHGVGPTDLSCRALALAYHDINPDKSIYHRLFSNGKIMSIVMPEDIERLKREPPSDTRAWLRGEVIKRYPGNIIDLGWDYMFFNNGDFVEMKDPVAGNREQIAPLLADNPSFGVFYERMKLLFASITPWNTELYAARVRPPRRS